MKQSKKYIAFISYKREDIKEAKRLQHALEYYRLPNHLRQERPDLPEYVRPVFRDMTDLEVGELSAQIHSALEQSQFLIVVCSPSAAASKWVNAEVEYFISLGNAANIIPYIIQGVPHAGIHSQECFPSALLKLSKEKELLGANVNEVGRDSAIIRIVSRIFNIRFDTLYQRYMVEQKKKRRRFAIAIASIIIFLSFFIGWISYQNTLLKEEEWKLMETQAHFLAEKGERLIDEQDLYLARLLALNILPEDLENPNRPYVPEAEALLRKALVKNDRFLRGHDGDVNSFTFSKDGKYAVSASDDCTIRIWDFKVGRQLLKTLKGHTDWVTYASFSRDSKYILSASDDKTIRVWDVMSGCQVGEPMSHDYGVDYVTYSQDETQAIAVSDGTVWVWDLDTRKLVGEPREPNDYHIQSSTLISPDGSRAVSDVYPHGVAIWDIETGETIAYIPNRYLSASTSSFSSDGKFLAIASDYMPESKQDCSIQVWNLDDHTMTVLEGHTSHIINISFSIDGMRVISRSSDNTLRLWDIESSKELDQWYLGESWTDANLTPDGEIIILNNNIIKIIDTDRNKYFGAPRRWTTDEYPDIFPISNNKTLITQSWGGWIMDLDKGEVDSTIYIDGEWKFFRNCSSKLAICESDDGLLIWDVKSNTKYKVDWLKHNDYITSLSLSRDNKYLMSASADSTVKIWNISNHQQVGQALRHRSKVYSAAFSNDGNLVVTGSEDGAIMIWDIKNNTQIGEPIYQDEYVQYVEFSLDDRSILSLSGLSSICVWDVENRMMKEINIEGCPSISSVSYSPDGKYIIASEQYGEPAIYILDVTTGQQVCESMKVYTDTNHEILPEIRSAVFTPDSRQIIATLEKSFIVWDFPPLQELIDHTNEQLKDRQLTIEEKRMFYLY